QLDQATLQMRSYLDEQYKKRNGKYPAPSIARHVPVLIAAQGPRTMRLAAQWDGWIPILVTPEVLEDGIKNQLHPLMKQLGRSREEINNYEVITYSDGVLTNAPETRWPEI